MTTLRSDGERGKPGRLHREDAPGEKRGGAFAAYHRRLDAASAGLVPGQPDVVEGVAAGEGGRPRAKPGGWRCWAYGTSMHRHGRQLARGGRIDGGDLPGRGGEKRRVVQAAPVEHGGAEKVLGRAGRTPARRWSTARNAHEPSAPGGQRQHGALVERNRAGEINDRRAERRAGRRAAFEQAGRGGRIGGEQEAFAGNRFAVGR